MPYPSVTFTEILSASTRTELEQLVALLQGYLSQEHDENGEHTHINALSLVVEDTASIGDDLDVGNGSVVISEQSGDAPGSAGGTGPGIRFNADPASATPGAWDLFVDTARVDNLARGYFLFRHAQRDRSIAGFRYDSDAGSEVYAFVPHDDIKETAGGECNLGSDSDGANQGWFNKGYIDDLYLGAHRTIQSGKWQTFSPTWTNLTVGNGTVAAKYARHQNMVQFWIHLTFGNTTSISGAVSVTVPVTIVAALNMAGVQIGHCFFRDDSATARYSGNALLSNTTTLALFDDANPHAAVIATVPFAFTTSDSIFIFGAYEAA